MQLNLQSCVQTNYPVLSVHFLQFVHSMEINDAENKGYQVCKKIYLRKICIRKIISDLMIYCLYSLFQIICIWSELKILLIGHSIAKQRCPSGCWRSSPTNHYRNHLRNGKPAAADRQRNKQAT